MVNLARWAAVGASLAWAVWPGRASADPAPAPEARPSVRVKWDAPAGCATLDDEREAWRALTGLSVRGDDAAVDDGYTVHVVVRPEGADWRAEVRLLRGSTDLGHRELRAADPSCRALDRSLALTVALLLDLEVERVAQAMREAEERRDVPPPRAAADVAPPPRPVSSPAPPPVGWAWLGTAGAAGVGGLMPQISPAIDAGLEASPPGWRPRVRASGAWLPAAASGSSPGLSMTAWVAALAVCSPLVDREVWGVEACAGAFAGRVGADGRGLSISRDATVVLVGADVRAAVWLHAAGPLSVGAHAEALTPFATHDFTYTAPSGELSLHRTSLVLPSLGLELRIRFAGPPGRPLHGGARSHQKTDAKPALRGGGTAS